MSQPKTMNFSAENMHRWDVVIAEAELRVKEMKQSVSRFKVMKDEGWDCPFELAKIEAKANEPSLKDHLESGTNSPDA